MARPVDVKSLYRGRTASAGVVQRGMAGLERELRKRHDEQERRRTTGRQHTQQSLKPLLDMMEKDQGAIQGVQGLRSLHRSSPKTLTPPAAPKESQHIFIAGASVVPLYDYVWTWKATSGNPTLYLFSAENTTGRMQFLIRTDEHQSSSASVAAAVGIYFSPLVEQGFLHISANPPESSQWDLECFFNSAHSDGWIGLYVGSYDLNGGFTGAPINLQFSLWSEDIFIDTPSNGGEGTWPLQANFSVDSNHFYAIWVWCGGSVSGAGFDNFFGSGAGSGMQVNVPSITWQLSQVHVVSVVERESSSPSA